METNNEDNCLAKALSTPEAVKMVGDIFKNSNKDILNLAIALGTDTPEGQFVLKFIQNAK